NVARPGLYELELGTPLSELLELAGAEPPKAVLLGGAAGSFLRPDELDLPRRSAPPAALVRGRPRRRRHARLGRRDRLRRAGGSRRRGAAYRRVLPRRVVRPVRPLPHRDGSPGGGAAPARLRQGERRRDRGARRPDTGDARRVHLWARPDCGERRRLGDPQPRSARVKITIDDVTTEVEGGTILDAARQMGIDTPTLCYG